MNRKSSSSCSRGSSNGDVFSDLEPGPEQEEAASELESEKVPSRPPPLQLVRQTVRRPCCVCCTSICTAFALTCVMMGGLATGVFDFALDTSPASFKVKYDSIADRGDAFLVFRRGSTSRSPRWVKESNNDDVGCQFGTCDTGHISNASFYFAPWSGASIYYEARGGEDYTKGGVAGENLFTADAMREIRGFEDDIRALPSYGAVCDRSQAGVAVGKALVDLTLCKPFDRTPTLLGFGTRMSVPLVAHCCLCNGSSPVAGDPCMRAPICGEVTQGAQQGVSVILPDGRAAAVLTDVELSEALQQLWVATKTCKKPVLPGAVTLGSFLDRGFATSRVSGTSSGALRFGGVTDLTSFQGKGSSKRFEEVDKQWKETIRPAIASFMFNELIPLTERFNEESTHVRIAMLSDHHLDYELLQKSIPSAMFWSIFSFAFVIVYMSWHTQSPLLALAGFGHVLISFPTAWFFYYCVFQIKYMGFLNFISLFVILGIGADDVFVFVDAWRQSRYEAPEISGSVETRLDWAYRRASTAMLVTSLTDCCAFYSNMLNTIVVVRIFGLFMGTMVLVNYALVITYFPAVVVLHHRWGFEERSECARCWRCFGTTSKTAPESTAKEAETLGTNGYAPDDAPRRHVLERFFGESYARSVLQHRSYFVVALFVMVTIVFGIFAWHLKPSDKDFRAQSFPDDSNLMRAIEMGGRFESGDFSNTQEILFVIGLGPDAQVAINRANVDPNNPKDYGDPIFIPLSAWTAEAQEHLLTVCSAFEANQLVAATQRTNSTSHNERGVICFIRHFRDWVLALGRAFPVVPPADFEPLLAEFTAMPANFSCTEPRCRAYFDTITNYPSAYRHWFSVGERAWHDYVRWDTGGKREATHEGPGGNLVGLVFEMNITMAWDVSGYDARSIFDKVERTSTEVNAAAPSAALRGFQVNWQGEDQGSKWMQMRTDEVMQTSAFVGIVISLVFAFVVLVVATANMVVTAFAMISIAAIVICCVGFMVMCGWTFGMIEAVCVTICVGFSIDFVAHVAFAYTESPASLPRFERCKQALEELGISVTAAMVTTAGAAVFMLPNRMKPFQKIGAFIIFDICVSFLFTVGLFAALLSALGPEKGRGNVGWLRWRYWSGRAMAVVPTGVN